MAREKGNRSRVHRCLRRGPHDSLRDVPKESRLVRPGKRKGFSPRKRSALQPKSWQRSKWTGKTPDGSSSHCQDTGTWLRIGWQGRTVALHLLRAVNASGVLSDLGEEPDLVLSELLRLPAEVVTPGLAALVRTETVTLALHGKLVWTKFLEAQKSRKSEAQRKAEYRAKHRAEAINAQGGQRVPNVGQIIPKPDITVRSVRTKGTLSPRREEKKERKKRQDKKPSGTSAAADPKQLGMPLGDEGAVEPPKDKEPDPVPTEQHLAIQVFAYLLAAPQTLQTIG